MQVADNLIIPYWLTFNVPESIVEKGFVTFAYFVDFNYWFIAAWMKF